MGKEFKSIELKDVDLKFEGGELRKFSGYASVFNGDDSYHDTILLGAFKDSLAKYGLPKMFYGHQWGLPIGKWTSAVEDEKGLRVEGELTHGNPQADAVLAALKHGTVDGLSIGFSMRGGAQDEKKEGGRVIKSVGRLFEISVVSFPADGAARITEVRSEDLDEIESIRDLEGFLRDAGGFSKSAATALVAKARKLFKDQRESEADEEKATTELLERIRKLEKSIGE